MKKTIDISVFDLEEDDTIEGYKLRDLLIFARTAREANIDNTQLADFVKNLDKAVEVIREDIADCAMKSIMSFKGVV